MFARSSRGGIWGNMASASAIKTPWRPPTIMRSSRPWPRRSPPSTANPSPSWPAT
jgi:hypothetical protein